jgi:hypothetical protein
MLILGGIALIGFATLYLLDAHVTGAPSGDHTGFSRYLHPEPGLISDATSGLAAMTAAVLGIVITVVSLLVQLTAARYTGVAQMFLRDRTNITVMTYYVITCVFGVAVGLSLHTELVPRVTLFTMMGFVSFGLIMMLPYFTYVFRFLEPTNLIARIEAEALVDVREAMTTRDPQRIDDAQSPALSALEELTDITSNSISGRDKIIASRAVDAIKDFVINYLKVKGKADERWFQIGEGIRDNPDFVAMQPESLQALENNHTWLEWKALRQYLGIYAEASAGMPDINYLIAIDTRYVAEAALKVKDRQVIDLAFRFMNSYLRAALNARQVRTAYNIMNQYRLMVEAMIRGGADDEAIEGVRYMIYYGRTSYDMQLVFNTETVAYDVSSVVEFAHVQKRDVDAKMLEMFLDLDQPIRLKKQETGLQGIRKAQLKLACYYLAVGADDRAQKIADDMKGEDRARLDSIREQLSKVESKEFWEVTDRGGNFEYMPPKQKEQMERFFGMLS